MARHLPYLSGVTPNRENRFSGDIMLPLFMLLRFS